MSKQPEHERKIARSRLNAEVLVTADELAPQVNYSARTIERYISRGCRGVHLDGFYRPDVGWLTSRPAWERFTAALVAAGLLPEKMRA